MKKIISIIVLIVILVVIALIAMPKNNNNSTVIEVGNKQALVWNTSSVSSPKVMVNIIKKVSSNPNTYELVRTVSENTSNDGSATWVPSTNDVNDNLLVEIGCTPTENECRAQTISSDLAVIDSSKYQNVASAYKAIESAENN